MKNSYIPQSLLKLPQPWSLTSNTHRKKQLRALKIKPEAINKALDVLEQCLQALSLLKPSSEDSLPESLIEYWELSVEHLSNEIPSLEYFSVNKVKAFLEDQGIDKPSDTQIDETVNYWLWWIAQDTAKAALKRIGDALRTTKETKETLRLLDIISRYWSKIDEQFAQSLLSRCAVIAGQRALPLLQSVEQGLSTPESIKNTVRDYRNLVLEQRAKV